MRDYTQLLNTSTDQIDLLERIQQDPNTPVSTVIQCSRVIATHENTMQKLMNGKAKNAVRANNFDIPDLHLNMPEFQ